MDNKNKNIDRDNLLKKRTLKHPFHILPPSPLPFLFSVSLLVFVLGFTCYIHDIKVDIALNIFAFSSPLVILFFWWRDVIIESTVLKQHTVEVMKGIKMGMALFIVSEVMFFFAFFWAFFHSSLSPAMGIGFVWPPQGIKVINPWGMPLLNTMLLLTSGATITWAHHSLLGDNEIKETAQGIFYTLLLGIVFLFCQKVEYQNASFTIADGIYGSLFYMMTGFHGLHVLVGVIFIGVCYIRLLKRHFTPKYHVGFECAIWYWHFVDIVWILLFFVVYVWGSS
jgi:heme/copper-type cytochrome/quinol oxidase subunit 3